MQTAETVLDAEDSTDQSEPMDQEDLARVLATFRGQPARATPTMRYVRRAADGLSPAYVFDEDTGMVYVLD